jgi:hypothetical protein
MYREDKQPLWGIVYGWLLAKVAEDMGVLPGADFRAAYEAGQCRLPVSKPELNARLLTALETKM